jgi:hypothetical protein
VLALARDLYMDLPIAVDGAALTAAVIQLMTWSFRGPDGRATFEWVQIDGALAVRWRRILGHSIFKQP